VISNDTHDTLQDSHSTTAEKFDHSNRKLLFLIHELQFFISGKDMLSLSLVCHQMFDVVSRLVSLHCRAVNKFTITPQICSRFIFKIDTTKQFIHHKPKNMVCNVRIRERKIWRSRRLILFKRLVLPRDRRDLQVSIPSFVTNLILDGFFNLPIHHGERCLPPPISFLLPHIFFYSKAYASPPLPSTRSQSDLVSPRSRIPATVLIF
jgi:hypothetical protein